MVKAIIHDWSFRRRAIITIILSAVAVIIVGNAFRGMQMGLPDMHIIFPLLFGLTALGIALLTLWTLYSTKRFKKAAGVLIKCYFATIIIGLTGFIVLQGFIISGARTQEAEVDAIIVLGAGLRNDEPSVVLRTRLRAALEYAQTREGVPIIVSGGLGSNATITEAEAMRNYLVSAGFDESLIWLEQSSTNTYENLTYSRVLMAENGIDVENAKVAVVSNEFHLFRAKLIAQNAGLDAVGVAAPTPTVALRALYFFREAFALAAQVFF